MKGYNGDVEDLRNVKNFFLNSLSINSITE